MWHNSQTKKVNQRNRNIYIKPYIVVDQYSNKLCELAAIELPPLKITWRADLHQTTAVKFEDMQDILEKKIDNHITILHKWSFHLNLSVNGRKGAMDPVATMNLKLQYKQIDAYEWDDGYCILWGFAKIIPMRWTKL